MLIKLSALGALGYVGYRYLTGKKATQQAPARDLVAGGPLSSEASLRHTPDLRE